MSEPQSAGATATVRITPLPDARPISREVYGHFLEQAFFGNVEGGVFDEGSSLSITEDGPLRGCRADVIDACRQLGLPVVRWPGGNVTSAYWWRDGTGPRGARPRRLELAWGSEETNRFGTPEFLAWCQAVGTRPFLVHSMRSVDDAVRWVEYTNHPGDTEMTRLRTTDGLPKPAPVTLWGLGNEVYGPWQMGQRPVGDYVRDARQHARFMSLVDPALRYVAVGDGPTAWTEEVVAGLGDVVDHVSLHLYGASRHLTDPSLAEYEAVVAQSAYVEQVIAQTSDHVARAAAEHGIARPLSIALEEWTVRHLEPASWPEPAMGDDGGTAQREIDGSEDAAGVPPARCRVNRYSSRTLADALFYAGVFHAIARAAQRAVPVGLATTVNLVNANALLEVRPGGLVRSASYHVWDVYQNRTGAVPLAAEVTGPARTVALRQGDDRLGEGFRTVPSTCPMLDVSPTASADGTVLHVAVVNRSADTAITARIELGAGLPALPPTASARRIGADVDDLFAVNTLDRPDVVALRAPEPVDLADGTCVFPPHSITVLDVPLR